MRGNYSKLHRKELVEKLGRGHVSIEHKARRLGLKSARSIGTESIRHDYFDRIDTRKKAYLLGLLASDGTISENSCIRLVMMDQQPVFFARDELAPKARILYHPSTDAFKLSITSESLARALGKYGVVPRKSWSLVYPSLPKKFERSFLLGYFDGDGSVFWRRSRNGRKTYPCWCLYGRDVFLLTVAQTINEHLGIELAPPRRPRKNRAVWVLEATASKALRIDRWLHSNGLGIPRKRLQHDQR